MLVSGSKIIKCLFQLKRKCPQIHETFQVHSYSSFCRVRQAPASHTLHSHPADKMCTPNPSGISAHPRPPPGRQGGERRAGLSKSFFLRTWPGAKTGLSAAAGATRRRSSCDGRRCLPRGPASARISPLPPSPAGTSRPLLGVVGRTSVRLKPPRDTTSDLRRPRQRIRH